MSKQPKPFAYARQIEVSDMEQGTRRLATICSVPGEPYTVPLYTDAVALASDATQAPTLYQYRAMPTWHGGRWTEWTNCTAEAAADYRKLTLLHEWRYEVRELYAAPVAISDAAQAPIYQAMATDDDPANSDVWMDVDRRGFDCMSKRSDVRTRIVYAEPAAPAAQVTDEMVSRFLGWRLPEDFAPDCGVSFKPLGHPNGWPVGTNLFTAKQARAMLEHVLAVQAVATAEAASTQVGRDYLTLSSGEWAESLKNQIREYGRKCVRGYAAGETRIEVSPTWTNIETLIDEVIRPKEGFCAPTPTVASAAGAPSIAASIHYPDCWDTAAYPTLESALSEVYAAFKCSECGVEWRPATIAAAQPDNRTAPFENCAFRHCDLPGQCKAEGACHHPARAHAAKTVAQPDKRVIEQMARAMNIATDGHDRYWSGYMKSAEAAYGVAMQARATAPQATLTDEQIFEHWKAVVGDGPSFELAKVMSFARAILANHPNK